MSSSSTSSFKYKEGLFAPFSTPLINANRKLLLEESPWLPASLCKSPLSLSNWGYSLLSIAFGALGEQT